MSKTYKKIGIIGAHIDAPICIASAPAFGKSSHPTTIVAAIQEVKQTKTLDEIIEEQNSIPFSIESRFDDDLFGLKTLLIEQRGVIPPDFNKRKKRR